MRLKFGRAEVQRRQHSCIRQHKHRHFHCSTNGAARSEILKSHKVQFLPASDVVSALIDGPVAGSGRRAAGGLFAGLIWAVAVGGGVSNAWTAGRRGGTGGRLGFDLQPLVSQSLGKVVVDGHTDGELLGAGLLVVHAEAPLEMLLNHVVVVAFGNHWKGKGSTSNTRLSESPKASGYLAL